MKFLTQEQKEALQTRAAPRKGRPRGAFPAETLSLLEELREAQQKIRSHNEALISLCDKHLDDKWPTPECFRCELDELRQRLVDEHEGSPGVSHARLWEKQCHDAETKAYLAQERIKELEKENAALHDMKSEREATAAYHTYEQGFKDGQYAASRVRNGLP